jgi:beta-glucuronidase
MPRAVTALAVALLTLAGVAALALAQGGRQPPAGDRPTHGALYDDGHMGRYMLDGTWYFRLDPTDEGEALGLPTNPALDGWSPTRIPNAWNATDQSDASQRGTVGWYRKDFVLPSREQALGWKLRFESVNYRAKVWLNGVLLGEHEGAYLPWELSPSGLARKGVNRLVVRVDNRRGRGDVPKGGDRANGRPGGGWWNYGGLLREVYLRRFEAVDVESVRVRTELADSQRRALLRFRVQLVNPGEENARFLLRTKVGDIERLSQEHIRVNAGESRTVHYTVRVPEPRLWEPGASELYPVRVEARHGAHLLSGYRLNVGIREIRVTDDGLLLVNGHRVKLLGASIHEDHPRRGAALRARHRERDMRLVGELGATIIRSHYPLHPQYLELADRMGVMVWDQVPVYSQGYKGFDVPGVTEKALAYVRGMVERDQNHPSVLAWSVANELSARMTDNQLLYLRRAAQLLHELDPTRLRTVDVFGWPQVPPDDIYHRFDALGINNYFGWYPGPNGQTEDRHRLGPFLDQMREYYPELALFVTEFGAEANREGSVDRKGTYAFQSKLMRHHVRTYIRKPYLNGAVAWILRNFRVRPDWEGGNPTPQPPWNQKGLTNARARKKPAFKAVAKLYKTVPPVAKRLYPAGASR